MYGMCMGLAGQLDTGFERHIEIDVVRVPGETPMTVYGGKITPRGVVLPCTLDQVSMIHDLSDQQAKYQSILVKIHLIFGTGETIHIGSEAQIQNIRRVSQNQFDVEMTFRNMMPDGYRHISRYLVTGSQVQKA